MEHIRSLAKHRIMKWIVAILLLSFILSGLIGYIQSRSIPAVAVINGKKVMARTVEAYLNRVRNNIYNGAIANNDGQMTNELIQYLGSGQFVQDTVAEMLQTYILRTYAEELGLHISNRMSIKTGILSNNNFKNAQGEFDPELYRNILAASRLQEQDLLEELKENILANLVTSTTVEDIIRMDEAIAKDFYQFEFETRTADIIVVKAENLKTTLPSATTAELQQFYQDNPDIFQLPELRSFNYLRINPKQIATKLTVSEAEVEQYYQEHADEFTTPETRSFFIFANEDPEILQQLIAQVNGGTPLATAVKQLLKKDLAIFLRENIAAADLSETFAQQIFNTSVNQFSNLIVSDDKVNYVFYVKQITAAKMTPLAQVKPELRKTLLEEKRSDYLTEFLNGLDDAIISATNLAELAQKLDLRLQTVSAIDQYGFNAYHELDSTVETLQPYLEEIFSLPAEQISSTVYAEPEDVYYIFEVTDIQPAQLADLAKSPELVRKQWQQHQLDEQVRLLASQIRDQISRQNLVTLQRQYGFELRRNVVFNRVPTASNSHYFNTDLVNDLFGLSQINTPTQLYHPQNKQYIFAVLKNIAEAEEESEEHMNFNAYYHTFNDALNDEMLASLRNYLGAKFKVKINQNVLNLFINN